MALVVLAASGAGPGLAASEVLEAWVQVRARLRRFRWP